MVQEIKVSEIKSQFPGYILHYQNWKIDKSKRLIEFLSTNQVTSVLVNQKTVFGSESKGNDQFNFQDCIKNWLKRV